MSIFSKHTHSFSYEDISLKELAVVVSLIISRMLDTRDAQHAKKKNDFLQLAIDFGGDYSIEQEIEDKIHKVKAEFGDRTLRGWIELLLKLKKEIREEEKQSTDKEATQDFIRILDEEVGDEG